MTTASASKGNATRAGKTSLNPASTAVVEGMLEKANGSASHGGRRKASASPEAEIIIMERSEAAPALRPARSGGRRKMSQLSKKQQDILTFIENYIEDNNWPPTVREIQMALKISSTSVVDYNLDALETKGHIIRKSGKSRAIELVNKPKRANQTEYIPILGTIAAGSPLTFATDVEDQLEVPSFMFKGKAGPDVFALRVKGDSMIDALIADGDIVLIRQVKEALPGETVAVWLKAEGETTLKQWFPEPNQGRVRLQPANSTMQPIYTTLDNAEVKGKLVGVIRSMF